MVLRNVKGKKENQRALQKEKKSLWSLFMDIPKCVFSKRMTETSAWWIELAPSELLEFHVPTKQCRCCVGKTEEDFFMIYTFENKGSKKGF